MRGEGVALQYLVGCQLWLGKVFFEFVSLTLAFVQG